MFLTQNYIFCVQKSHILSLTDAHTHTHIQFSNFTHAHVHMHGHLLSECAGHVVSLSVFLPAVFFCLFCFVFFGCWFFMFKAVLSR